MLSEFIRNAATVCVCRGWERKTTPLLAVLYEVSGKKVSGIIKLFDK